ncbi:hypothetical protein MTR67_023433 [Solanum verrucosum]|uniref:Uncharacterized protein n=1 Tax=Solanum verrucosum TaxID=315347 RepID=A0AAF0QX34_SOLVR|nr:hypothetical protein MTR67_023433 [Solanum verrucosum]
MHLPLLDVVRTSFLSKNWKYKWCTFIELKFDQTLYDTAKGKKSLVIQFDNIFKHLKVNLVEPIKKFTLDVTGLESWPIIHDMTYFFSRNGIHHLAQQCLIML